MSDKTTEISFKDFFVQIREWVQYLFSKWIFIGAVGILGTGCGFIYAYFSAPKYIASVSFVLSNNNNSGGGLMGLASQFGINLGTTGSDNAFAGDNIIVMMKSRKMMQTALLKKPDGKISLLNMMVKKWKLDEKWDKNNRLKEAFPFPGDASAMTLVQDSLFREIYLYVQANILEVAKPDKQQAVYAVTATSSDDTLAYFLPKYLVDVTSKFYIDTKTSTAKQNLAMLKTEADSLRDVLGGVITSAATQADLTFNLNPAYQAQRSGVQQNQVKASAVGEAYGEVLKNLEIAKITLLKETPLYQIIDEPVLPLQMYKRSWLTFSILGGIIAVIIVSGYLIVKQALNHEN